MAARLCVLDHKYIRNSCVGQAHAAQHGYCPCVCSAISVGGLVAARFWLCVSRNISEILVLEIQFFRGVEAARNLSRHELEAWGQRGFGY